MPPPRPSSDTCAAEGCEVKGKLRRGLCNKHYTRLYRTGDMNAVRPANPGKGRVKHPLYGGWVAMKNRCYNPNNSSYDRYGARGVTVCERWREDFLNFVDDMGERPAGTTLDRIDPRGPYAPENCRWATAAEQRANLDPEREANARAVNSAKKSAYWEAVRSGAATYARAVK